MAAHFHVGDFVRYTPEPNGISGQINSISPDYQRAFVVYPIGRPYIYKLADLELIQKGTLSHFSWDLSQQFIEYMEVK
jgi:hypothetical protein